MRQFQRVLLAAMIAAGATAGCERQQASTAQTQAPSTPAAHHHHDDDDHDHGHDHHHDGHHGPLLELGTQTIGSYGVRAACDAGELTPGGDAPIDLWLTGDLRKITVVRCWIGTEDAAGSIKARAEREGSATPEHFHAHAELPIPLPPDSKLWVELDVQGEGKQLGSFELNVDS